MLFPLFDRPAGRATLSHLRRLEQTQWCSPEELADIQAKELGRLLSHAYEHVPFYRRRFEAAGITPSEIHRAQDLSVLPLLSRAEAHEAGGARRSLVPPIPTITKSTSGTTGAPLRFSYDEGSEHWRQAVRMRGYGWAGYRQGDRAFHYWSVRPPSSHPSLYWRTRDRIGKARYRMFRNEYWADSTIRSEERLAAAVKVIRRKRPRTIVCFTQGGVELARYVVANRLRAWGTIPVLCGAEKLLPPDRKVLEQAFGEAVFETYGGRETMLIASECEEHDGLHLQEENLIVELVVRDEDGSSGRPARPGETGEVVVTDLHNLAMPFIRYVTGDLAVAGDGSPCRCGRGLSRIGDVVGRSADTLRDGAGTPVSGLALVTLLITIDPAARQFQIVQHRDRSLTVRLVPTSEFDDETRAQISRYCGHYLPGVSVEIELVDEIPLEPSGKRRFIVSEAR